MKIRFFKNESGQALILMALALVVLMVFTAVTIDVGMVSIQKGKLQNAIDAAALAAAQALPADTQAHKDAATAAANDYVRLNGFLPADISVSFPDANHVKINATKKVPYTFAQVFGLTEATVQNTASAEKTIISGGGGGGSFDYVLFSEGALNDFKFDGGGATVKGNVYVNGNIDFSGITVNISGSTKATGVFNGNSKATLAYSQEHAAVETMPSAPALPVLPVISGTFQPRSYWINKGYYEWNGGNVTINEPIYCTGDFKLGANGEVRITGNGCIVATGNINLTDGSIRVVMDTNNPIGIRSTGGTVKISSPSVTGAGAIIASSDIEFGSSNSSFKSTNPIAIYSENGNVKFTQTTLIDATGIVYAKGYILMQGGTLGVSSKSFPAVYSKTSYINFTNTINLTGAAYAPNGYINFQGSKLTLKGSLVAKKLTITNTLDAENGTGSGGGEPTTTKIKLVN